MDPKCYPNVKKWRCFANPKRGNRGILGELLRTRAGSSWQINAKAPWEPYRKHFAIVALYCLFCWSPPPLFVAPSGPSGASWHRPHGQRPRHRRLVNVLPTFCHPRRTRSAYEDLCYPPGRQTRLCRVVVVPTIESLTHVCLQIYIVYPPSVPLWLRIRSAWPTSNLALRETHPHLFFGGWNDFWKGKVDRRRGMVPLHFRLKSWTWALQVSSALPKV